MLGLGFVFSLGRNIAFPYLFMYLTETQNGGLGLDAALVGSVFFVGGLTYTFTLLVTGSLCDRFGRKTMMITSLIPQTLLVAVFFFVRTYPEVMLTYAGISIAGAFFDPAYGAMIADLVQPDRREQVYGLSYMINNVGTIVGPLIGGIVVGISGYAVLYLYAAIFAAATVTGIVSLMRESKPVEIRETSLSQFAGIFRERLFIFFCFLCALTSLIYSQLYGLLSVYTQYVGFDPIVFGILFSVNGAMVVALQIPIRIGATRIGPAKTFVIAQTLYAVGFTFFMVAVGFNGFLTGVVILTLGEIMFVPASSGFVANLAPSDKRGRYMAIVGLFLGIGSSAGYLIAFTLYDMLADKKVTWGILGLIGFATVFGYLLLLRMAKQKAKS